MSDNNTVAMEHRCGRCQHTITGSYDDSNARTRKAGAQAFGELIGKHRAECTG